MGCSYTFGELLSVECDKEEKEIDDDEEGVELDYNEYNEKIFDD